MLVSKRFRSHPFLYVVLILGLIPLIGGPAEAKKKRRAPKPVHIRNISVESVNVFDPTVPGENFWLFRLANHIHIPTRPSVIRREMLMYPGDWTDLERIAESERNLRALPFIKEASIVSSPTPDGRMDLLVKTQDSWTTQPQFNVSSEGGDTNISGGFEEVNLFGYGKDIAYLYKNNVDGVTNMISYNDPQFLNTRTRLSSTFQDTPTGNAQDLNISRPFYSLATRMSAGLPFAHSQGLQKVYAGGAKVSQYDQERLAVAPFVGWRVNNDPLNVMRLQLTYRYSETVSKAQDVTLPGTLPANTSLSGPIIGFSYTQSDFIKETFIEKTGRVEDFNLGHEASAGIGYIDRKLGATENTIPFSINDSFGFGGSGPWFGLLGFGTSSRYALYAKDQTGGRLINTIYFANFSAFRHLIEAFPMTGAFHVESAYLQNPEADNVLSLGGDTGLRGFKVNAFTGNKTLLLNLENRFYYPREVFHLAYVGGAFFVDAGQAQPQGMGFTRKDFHADIGVGMRFGLSRSADGTVFRVDLAYAVGPVPDNNRWILSISSGQGFKRNGNTYRNFASAMSTQ